MIIIIWNYYCNYYLSSIIITSNKPVSTSNYSMREASRTINRQYVIEVSINSNRTGEDRKSTKYQVASMQHKNAATDKLKYLS